MSTSRRVMPQVPRLAGRPWEDANRDLQEYLRKLKEAWGGGIPPGYSATTPEAVEAGDTGSAGTELLGWVASNHEHPVVTGEPSLLGNIPAEGTSPAIPRLDHQHKRDVRVKEDDADVGTRNALNFLNADLEWTVADDAGNDELEISGKLSDVSRTFVGGATRLGVSGASDYIVWEAPFAATVLAVRGIRVGGSAATINARRNLTSEHLSGDLSLTGSGTVFDGGAVQNTAYVAGDILEARVKSATGSPDVTVLIRLRRD